MVLVHPPVYQRAPASPAFKQYARSPEISEAEALVADIRAFAGYFCAIALGAEKDPDLQVAFHDIRELRVDVAYPLLG